MLHGRLCRGAGFLASFPWTAMMDARAPLIELRCSPDLGFWLGAEYATSVGHARKIAEIGSHIFIDMNGWVAFWRIDPDAYRRQ